MIDYEKLFQDALGVHKKFMEKNFGDKMNMKDGQPIDEDKNMKDPSPFPPETMDRETAEFMMKSMDEASKRHVKEHKPKLYNKIQRALRDEIYSGFSKEASHVRNEKSKQELFGTWGLFGDVLRKIPITNSKNYTLDRRKADAMFTVTGVNASCVSMLCTWSKTGVGMSRVCVFPREKFTCHGDPPRLKYVEGETLHGRFEIQ